MSEGPAARWSRRDMLLVASLAVNLLFVGFLIGRGARSFGPPPPPRGEAANPLHPRALMEALEPRERRAAFRALRRTGTRLLPLSGEARDSRLALAAVLRAEPFDPEAARAALARVRDADNALHEAGQAAVVELLGRLSAQERANIASEIEGALHDHPHARFGHGPRPGPGPDRER